MNNMVNMLRVMISGAQPVIDWNYQFYYYSSSEATDIYRRHDPALITTNPVDNTVIYLSGRNEGEGSVMQFDKRTGNLKWWTKFNNITNIRAVAQVPNDSIFYGCGDYQANEDTSAVSNIETDTNFQAMIFKMQSDGTV